MSDARTENEVALAGTRWTPAGSIEPNPDVTILLHGLMCLCNNDEGYCEVGIHKKAASHNFNVSVYEVSSGNFDPPADVGAFAGAVKVDSYDRNDTGRSQNDKVVFGAVMPRKAGVSFYQSDPQKSNPNDFLFITDFEGDDFHNQHLDKKTDAFGPMLHIPNATFYTLCKTTKPFKREAPGDMKSLGSVARVVAANIYLAEGGFVSLRMRGKEVRKLIPTSTKKFIVVVNNGCPQDVCKFKPKDPDKKKRNDFFQYYKTFEIPSEQDEFELKIDEDRVEPDAFDPCNPAFRSALDRLFEESGGKRGTDDSPCGASGFGSSGCIVCQ